MSEDVHQVVKLDRPLIIGTWDGIDGKRRTSQTFGYLFKDPIKSKYE
jgi:hypothetical protein